MAISPDSVDSTHSRSRSEASGVGGIPAGRLYCLLDSPIDGAEALLAVRLVGSIRSCLCAVGASGRVVLFGTPAAPSADT